MATYEARLATFVKHGWRGLAQPETLAKYGFQYDNGWYDNRWARCVSCNGECNDFDDVDDEWVLAHRDDCPFRQAALREDSCAQDIVRQQLEQKVHEQERLLDDLRQRCQALERQVDALECQKQALENEVEEKRALEKEMEEYASVKTALRTALGL